MDTKKLARRRAERDVEIEADEPKVAEHRNAQGVKAYERSKMLPTGRELDIVKEQGESPEYKRVMDQYREGKGEATHESSHYDLNKEQKKRKKFAMMKSLVKQMDDMDGNGIPDREER